MNLWGVTHVGVVRQQNQDAIYTKLVEPEIALGVVCDGMGGAKSGNVASQLAVDTFHQVADDWDMSRWKAEPEALLRTCAEQANQAVYCRAGVDPACHGMGTTMVAALVIGPKGYFLNIGDSRAYLVREDGITRITRDHSVVEDLVIQGKITPEEARQHPQKNLITRAMGAEVKLRADLFRQDLIPGDYLLLCSDGLINVVSDQEVLYEVIHGGEAAQCCNRLLDVAISRGAPDNVSIVLVQM